MKVKLIGCASTKNEVAWMKVSQRADCSFLDYSYHANPAKLKQKLQEIIDESQAYDLIILTFSRCSNSLVGLKSEKVPMIFPNTHDCIGLLFGSNEKHQKFFRENVGTYYFSQGWLDYGRTPLEEYLEYIERYGEEKARRFIFALYGKYTKAMLVITPGMKDLEHYRQRVKEIADFFGWETDEMEGDIGLLEAVLKGQRNEGVVYVEPGQKVTLEMFE